MPHDHVPRREGPFCQFALNVARQVAEGPGAFGLSDDDSAVLLGAAEDFERCLARARGQTTRGPCAVFEKNESRARLEKILRRAIARIQAFHATSDEQRTGMGLTIRKKKYGKTKLPDVAPKVWVERVSGRRVTYRVFDGGSTGRGRPIGTKNADLWAHVGERPPVDGSDWWYIASASRALTTVEWPSWVRPGMTVWLCAAWAGKNMDHGPWSEAVKVMISEESPVVGGGLSSAA